VIGIAGSVGKSSTKEVLYAILKDHFRTAVTHGNSETGVPLGILGISINDFSLFGWLKVLFKSPFGIFHLRKLPQLIVEMGTDDPFPPKNMDYLLTIVKPDLAIFLNTSAAHTMQFEKALTAEERLLSGPQKIEAILKKMAHEDGKIITKSDCKIAIYCADNQYVDEEIQQQKSKIKADLLSFGEAHTNDLFYGDYHVDLKKTAFELEIISRAHAMHEKITLEFHGYLLPKAYREVFAAATLAALKLSLKPKQIQIALHKNFRLPPGRATVFEGIHDSIIIDSSYNASPSAVEAFLELMKDLKKQTNRPVVFLFGDMKELGSEADFEHQQIAQKMHGIVDYLYCTGPLTKQYIAADGHKKTADFQELKWFESSRIMGEKLQKNLPHSAIVLVKGSQNSIFMEEAIKPLLRNKKDAAKLCRQKTQK